MVVFHCTRKLLDRLRVKDPGPPPEGAGALLGSWYATTLPWRPQAALLINERTLLPVIMPLAPAATLVRRFPDELARVLRAHGMTDHFIVCEIRAMDETAISRTTSRSLLGMLNEFSFLADVFRRGIDEADALSLSLKLAIVPCGPLKGKCPERMLEDLAQEHGHAL